MSKFFDNLLKESNTNVPLNIEQALYREFENAVNVDWHIKQEGYEAVFYDNTIEHIALLDENGKLVHYKVNLSPDKLEQSIRNNLEKKGEIMHVVELHHNGDEKFEVIIQNDQAQRFLLLLDSTGSITKQEAL